MEATNASPLSLLIGARFNRGCVSMFVEFLLKLNSTKGLVFDGKKENRGVNTFECLLREQRKSIRACLIYRKSSRQERFQIILN